MGANENFVIQSNTITTANYDYTALQKNVLYNIISMVQKHMTKEKITNSDLWGNLSLELDLKTLAQNSNYNEIHKAIKELMKKPISYYYKLPNGNIMDVTTTMIYTMKHERGQRKILLKVSQESIPALLYIGDGFTAYNKTIALSLPSVYAKRIYELCCRWKDRGFMRMKLTDFRKMLGIDIYDGNKLEVQKFKQIKELKAEVLDKSMKILREQADYTFRYVLIKENNSRAFNVIEFWIEGKEVTLQKEYTMYQQVMMFIQSVYNDNRRAYEVSEHIWHKGDIKKAADRMKRMQDDIKAGKVKKHGLAAYLSTVLIKDYEVPENMVISEKTKRTKKVQKIAAEILNEETLKGLNAQQRQEITRNTISALMKTEDKRSRKKGDVRSLGTLLGGG